MLNINNLRRYPCPQNKFYDYKTLYRGYSHVFVSIFMIIYFYIYDIWNIVSISCLLSALISSLFHLIPAEKYYNLSICLNYMDYVAINFLITSNFYDLVSLKYYEFINLYYLYIGIFVFGIDLFLFLYKYIYKHKLNFIIIHFCHIFNLLVCFIVNYYLCPVLAVVVVMYVIGILFYVSTHFIDEKHKIIWAHHDTFHLITSIIYIIHVYIYTYV